MQAKQTELQHTDVDSGFASAESPVWMEKIHLIELSIHSSSNVVFWGLSLCTYALKVVL